MKFSPILFASFVAFASFTMCVDDAIAGGGNPLKGLNVSTSTTTKKPCGLVKNPGSRGVIGNSGQSNTAGNRVLAGFDP
jgi:hypothetical protein